MRIVPRLRSSTYAVTDLFLAVGFLGVYLKAALLGREWDAVARFLDKAGAANLTVLERIGFFWQDVALNLIAIPIAATAILCLAFPRRRLRAALAIAMALAAVYFVELRAHAAVGQFISGDVLHDLIGWSMRNPEMARDYASAGSVVKFAMLLACLLGIALVSRWSDAARASGQRRADTYDTLLRAPVLVALPFSAALAVTSFACRLPNAQLNQSAVALAIGALIATDDARGVAFATFDDALAATRRDGRTMPPDITHQFVGRESGSDLLMFVMETGPARALDFAQAGPTLPGAAALLGRSFVAAQHYTTHPYSSDALYSILSGMYPQGRKRVLQGVSGRLNGLLTALRHVPIRRVYVPSLYNIKLDDHMYEVFGAETVYVADRHVADPMRTVAEGRVESLLAELQAPDRPLPPATVERLRRKLRGDLQALERAKADIQDAARTGQHYAIIFFPEIGHGPWIALQQDASTIARGRALMRLQDAWLKELIDTIRAAGRLDATVIVATADHGVRTRVEDPNLPVGRISDYMFHVPLLVHAPNTLTAPMPIAVPTSHIDLAPTIAALFGNTASAAAMQGVPIWQRASQNRLYLLAAPYGGADGYVENGRYCMRQALSGGIYCSNELAFRDGDQLPPDAPDVVRVSTVLDVATRLQQALVTRMLQDIRP